VKEHQPNWNKQIYMGRFCPLPVNDREKVDLFVFKNFVGNFFVVLRVFRVQVLIKVVFAKMVVVPFKLVKASFF